MKKLNIKNFGLSTVFFIAIIVLATALRLNNIGSHGLAGDEKFSLFVSQFVAYEGSNQHDSVRKPNSPYFTPKEFWSEKDIRGFYDAIARVDTGNGALYTFTLHYWSKFVGLADGNLRLLSLIFNVLTVILLYFFTKKHYKSDSLALIAMFLAAISPFYVTFSQVARNYAMQYFFSLLATHIFLLILDRDNKKNKVLLYIFYGIVALACELCHISTFTLFFIHGLYLLLFHRKLANLMGFGLAMLIPFVGVLAWLFSDGGKWLFDYVANSTRVYNEMARTSPDEFLSVATSINIIKQFRHVISCNFILLEGLYLKISGIKNIALFALAAFGIALSNKFFSKYNYKNWLLFAQIVAFGVLVFVLFPYMANVQNLVLFVNFLLFFELILRIRFNFKDSLHKKYLFLGMLSFLPFLFLTLFAIKDGNTFRIMPRYVGYSYAFGIVMVAAIIRYIFHLADSIKYYIFAGLFVQLFLIGRLIMQVWEDNPPRYFMTFAEPRKKNPYQEIANKIVQNYAVGDTVLYCSTYLYPTSQGKDMPQYSVVDAQLTNFYLPKDAEIIQRVNQQEKNIIYIKKSNGVLKKVFDFEGVRYRY